MSLRLLAAAATATLAPTLLVPSLAASSAGPGTAEPPGTLLGSYRSGFFDEGGAEIVAHDPARQQVFAVNAAAGTVDVLSIVDPSEPTKVGELATPGANSVAVRGRVVAVAEQADVATEPGRVAFFDARSLEPT